MTGRLKSKLKRILGLYDRRSHRFCPITVDAFSFKITGQRSGTFLRSIQPCYMKNYGCINGVEEMIKPAQIGVIQSKNWRKKSMNNRCLNLVRISK